MKIPNDKFLKLFSVCILVKGARRSMICDLQRGHYYYIPNDLHNFLTEYNGVRVDCILNDFKEEDKTTVFEYIEFLLKHDLIFFTSNPEAFPNLSLEWDEPSLVTNCIIDCCSRSKHQWDRIFNELESVGCRDVQIRFFDEVNMDKIYEVLTKLTNRRIKSVDLLLKFSKDTTSRRVRALTETFTRIRTVFIHSAPADNVAKFNAGEGLEDSMGNIIFVRDAIKDNSHCGIITPSLFSVNIKTFSEAIHFNSCLHRKVGIDIDGSIKNCPSLKDSFGNITTTNLLDVVKTKSFQELGKLPKDAIHVCRDCEHRYVCTDCRAFTREGDYLDKPLKCRYDPYTAAWSSE